jgi:hypothetical protein
MNGLGFTNVYVCIWVQCHCHCGFDYMICSMDERANMWNQGVFINVCWVPNYKMVIPRPMIYSIVIICVFMIWGIKN